MEKTCKAIYDAIGQRDVQGAADEFRPVYDETDGKDGYVSLDVNPHLAHDTKGMIAETRRLWVASAKGASQIYKEIFGSAQFKKLTDQGARVQRLPVLGINIDKVIRQLKEGGVEKLN